MLSPRMLVLASAFLAAASTASAQQTCLTTLFSTNNGGSVGGAVYFDIDVLDPNGVTLDSLEVNSSISAGTPITVDIYLASVTYVGNEQNPAAWTLVTSGAGTAAGRDQPSIVDLVDLPLPFGPTGFMIHAVDFDHDYTNGSGGNQNYADATLALSLGAASNSPWNTTTFSPRVWNGSICYNGAPCPPASTYCTPGTTSRGCLGTMSFAGTPSLANSSPFTVTCSGVEGAVSGILFYGITGRTAATWGLAGPSLLCVKAPVQRVRPPMNSGGTAGVCNGSFSMDWSAYQAANPGKPINQALAVGTLVSAQVWFLDPGSSAGPHGAKESVLSDALEFAVCP